MTHGLNYWNPLLIKKINTESETLIMSLITSKIEEEMKKEMPDPWYCYGFGGKEN